MPLTNPPPRPLPFTAASGVFQNPAHLSTAAGNTLTSGTFYCVPFDVGPFAKSYNALACNVTVAQSGGTATTTLGVYNDNGTGGLPNLVGGPLVSGTVVLTATGNVTTTVTWNPAPGRYWLAFLYVVGTAPTTAAQVMCVSNSVAMPVTTIGNSNRGWTATALAALPTTQIALTNSVGTTTCLVTARAA